ncbi:hypothetical protein ACW6QP_06920 [Salegentibacter sp. HM20]
MKFFIKFFLELLLLAALALIFYIAAIDFVIFNRYFYEREYLSWLFYLFPICLALAIILVAVWLPAKLRLVSLLLIILANCYLALSLFMITGIYCEEEKNFNWIYKGILLILGLIIFGIYYKKILPKFSKFDLLLIFLASLAVIAELYLNSFSFDLIYRNLYPAMNNS